ATCIASSGVRSALASPRTPSVPNSRDMLVKPPSNPTGSGDGPARDPPPEDPWKRLREQFLVQWGRSTAPANRSSDQRLLYCGALRAFLRPYFLRSFSRAS